ncbi:sulfite exporter TauE/SafE family protein [Luedemannella helvata]|uniref:Probable membrane transporter protein n=1 Tax=Luedemannella helvata TaxID=349315 RepID=A0ABP4X5E1_9ACTN
MDLNDALMLVAAGVAAGAVNALAGGGSLISYPALLTTGLGSVVANMTNSVSVSAGYLAAAFGTREDHRAIRINTKGLVLTTAVGTAAGGALLMVTPPAAFDRIVPFLVLGAVLVLAFQQRLRGLVGHPRDLRRGRRTAALHTMVGLGAIYGGYFGAALGIILVAVLGLVIDENLTRINALKNTLSLVVGLVTAVEFGLFGSTVGSPVNWGSVAVLMPATLLGGYAGARVGRRLSPRVLRALIVAFGTTVGLILFWRAFR